MLQHGDVCAVARFNWRQILFYVLVLCAIAFCFIRDPKVGFTVLTFLVCGFYGAVIVFRLYSVLRSMFGTHEQRVSAAEIAALKDDELPVYTVLVPMYKEPEVAQKIARTVTSLDYPLDKLDVKLLLEEDDFETRKKIEDVVDSLPHCVEVILAPVVPHGQPRTKPRACNWGLATAKGEYLVIFDAEDQPERDQLKKSIVAFRRLEAEGKTQVKCLQAKLNYFNARQNGLTAFFTLEYTTWFDLFLPGLHAVGTPIPLGGTSNHFKTAILRELGGWDSFNVTEDCDLGIRMSRKKYSTHVLDSTTWEEANSQVGNWIRQRSRWVKGYFQTHLVHTRDSFLPAAALGGVFLVLASVFGHDISAGGLETYLRSYAHFFQTASYVGAALAFLCSLASFFYRFRTAPREGQLSLWHAATFRFTVGGLSFMLLLNLIFWTMTMTYLFREPIARALPAPIARIKLDETTSVQEALLDWRLYYTDVKDEVRYSNVTFWNTGTALVSGQIDTQEAGNRLRAIDSWSLVSQLFFPVTVVLFVANFIFVLMGLISCRRRGLMDLFPFALLVPFYWVLISIAAVKGFWQLFRNPWYWEKTTHGLSAQPKAPGTSAPDSPTQPAAHAAGE
jgi:cellulose synthase/poly-beta-1,6-N-acetylglucosamine synthase-like glycosyltransferase